MTDRLNGVFVTFVEDIREDDAQRIIDAIKLIHGVIDVRGNVTNGSEWVANARAREKPRRALWDIIYPKDEVEVVL